MKAGRELDALVAEKVMGWVVAAPEPSHTYLAYHTPTGFRLPEEVPHYSTDISAAWEVVEALTRRGNSFRIVQAEPPYGVQASVIIRRGEEDYVVCSCEVAETPALAICLAALRAVGVEVPE